VRGGHEDGQRSGRATSGEAVQRADGIGREGSAQPGRRLRMHVVSGLVEVRVKVPVCGLCPVGVRVRVDAVPPHAGQCPGSDCDQGQAHQCVGASCQIGWNVPTQDRQQNACAHDEGGMPGAPCRRHPQGVGPRRSMRRQGGDGGQMIGFERVARAEQHAVQRNKDHAAIIHGVLPEQRTSHGTEGVDGQPRPGWRAASPALFLCMDAGTCAAAALDNVGGGWVRRRDSPDSSWFRSSRAESCARVTPLRRACLAPAGRAHPACLLSRRRESRRRRPVRERRGQRAPDPSGPPRSADRRRSRRPGLHAPAAAMKRGVGRSLGGAPGVCLIGGRWGTCSSDNTARGIGLC